MKGKPDLLCQIFVSPALDCQEKIMLFRRRKQMNMWERVRLWLWPRRSFSRSIRYMGKRVLRIPATPHSVALGLAIGVFAAFTPLYGLHIIVAIFVAWMLSANIAAAIIGTACANPLTIPLIFSVTYELGRTVLYVGDQSVTMHEFFTLLHDRYLMELWVMFLQLFIGSAVLGSIVAVMAYILTLKATTRFRGRRGERKGMQTIRKRKHRMDECDDHRNW